MNLCWRVSMTHHKLCWPWSWWSCILSHSVLFRPIPLIYLPIHRLSWKRMSQHVSMWWWPRHMIYMMVYFYIPQFTRTGQHMMPWIATPCYEKLVYHQAGFAESYAASMHWTLTQRLNSLVFSWKWRRKVHEMPIHNSSWPFLVTLLGNGYISHLGKRKVSSSKLTFLRGYVSFQEGIDISM